VFASNIVKSDRVNFFKSSSFILFLSILAMAPIWASGLSSRRAILYTVLFAALSKLTNFSKIRISPSLSCLATFAFGCLLLWLERASFLHTPIRIIIIVWLVLLTFVASNPNLRKLVLANLLVFGVLFLSLEIPFRFLTSSQSSSQFQYIELFRNSRSDGPGEMSQHVLNTDVRGLRVTTDQPSAPSGRILIFGGSTTFCGEVSDRFAYPSVLQRFLNDRKSGLSVENYGKSAATATDRVEVLKSIDDLNKDDIVIFYVGVNESGVGFIQRDLPVGLITKIPELGNALQKVSKYSRIADILFRKFVFGGIEISETSKLKAESDFRKAMAEAESLTRKAGAKFVPVLQATLFTRNPLSDYDQTLAKMYGSELGTVMPEMYDRLLPVISKYENFGDARSVMDNVEPSPYFDWMHVNASGDQKIATFMRDLLVDKKLID